MNVRRRNYSWASLYDRIIDLRRHSFSPRAVARRLRASEWLLTPSLSFVRAVSSEGNGRIRHHSTVRGLLDSDSSVRRFFEGDTTEVPSFCVERVRGDLGALRSRLPAGGLEHDAKAYLKSVAAAA